MITNILTVYFFDIAEGEDKRVQKDRQTETKGDTELGETGRAKPNKTQRRERGKA